MEYLKCARGIYVQMITKRVLRKSERNWGNQQPGVNSAASLLMIVYRYGLGIENHVAQAAWGE